MSETSPPFDRLEETPVWTGDGFDVLTGRNKGAPKYRGQGKVAIATMVMSLVLSMVQAFAHEWHGAMSVAAVAFFLLWAAALQFRSRRAQRLRGNLRRLTINKTFAKLSWNRRDFSWGQIQGFDTDVEVKNGHSDVFVITANERVPLGLELTVADADELAEALQKMRVRAKMETLARSGYRGARVAEEAEEPLQEGITLDTRPTTSRENEA